ncbi:hypothetical protein CEUSTIGMA_g11206.t1 [Chlamydomonas eustigma]|uniref:DUF1995 domain-containing protein n=1 Tax=Chlamydomonas eustigma TaxID=1157962 RepID=A0A250XL03_9CHLO|nr:hypothetical protein CEUSTIGMA_g11206.t1 [Chlamydomonas eustigma]|eukprot:GAX83781.1 hypothetical protein CEUSTIGMA_g11206.t1 [Chlamydomonas eustigma]
MYVSSFRVSSSRRGSWNYRQRRTTVALNANAAEKLSDNSTNQIPVPSSASQQTAQSAAAIQAAYKDGMRRQHVELLLPLIGATDLDDWPGGIRQQFKAAQPLVEYILRTVKQSEGLQGPLATAIWDQGDAVAAWTNTRLAAVLFPTAATMDKLKALVKKDGGPELLIVINPQWETKGLMFGQSDFGFGPWRAESEALVASLEPSYQFKQLRVYGDDVRLLKAHPGLWQVHVLGREGKSELIGVQDMKPTYQQVEALLRARPSSRMNMGLFDRLKDEYQWNQDSLKGPPT